MGPVLKQLWAPWRLEYIRRRSGGLRLLPCLGLDDEAGPVVRREARLRPPEPLPLRVRPPDGGALPARGSFRGSRRDEALEVHAYATATGVLQEVMGPQGFNLGWNLGRIAGAGIVDHVHQHVVPRWAGDTNFMPVLADVKVMPEALEATRRKLAEAWP